ncbi:hypothetical protein ACGC1H_004971 [Rhizoctonia solani]
MSLVARLKRESKGRGSDPKTVAVIDAATAEALRQLNVIREALVNAKPCSPSHSIPTPPSTSPPSRITGPIHPGLNTRVPVARAPEFPPLSESSESARVKSRRRSLGGMTDDEDSEMEHPARVTRRGGHGIPAPSYLESESEAELESKARRRTGRQSALLARGTGEDEREKSPTEPVVEIPVKPKSKPIVSDAKRSKRKLVESEPDDAIKSVGVIVDLPIDEEEFQPQHVRARAVNKLQDVTNSPIKAGGRIRDTVKVMEDEDEEPVVTGGYIGTPAISKISKPPRSRTFIPAPTSGSGRLTPTSGTDDDPTASGRERRARKSVNYAEPKLNTKMRKPTPDATSYGRFSLPSAKPRISTSIPRDSSPPPESPMPPLLEPDTNTKTDDAVTVRTRRRRPTSVATDDDDGAGTEYLDPDDDYVPTVVRRKSGGKLATDRRYSAAA